MHSLRINGNTARREGRREGEEEEGLMSKSNMLRLRYNKSRTYSRYDVLLGGEMCLAILTGVSLLAVQVNVVLETHRRTFSVVF